MKHLVKAWRDYAKVVSEHDVSGAYEACADRLERELKTRESGTVEGAVEVMIDTILETHNCIPPETVHLVVQRIAERCVPVGSRWRCKTVQPEGYIDVEVTKVHLGNVEHRRLNGAWADRVSHDSITIFLRMHEEVLGER